MIDKLLLKNEALQEGARRNSLETLRLFVESASVDVNIRGEENNTPLHEAAWHDSLECVKFLVESCADLSLRTDNNETALEVAQKVNKWKKKSKRTIKYLQDTDSISKAQAHCNR